jgi:hypothetical protein
MRVLSWKKKKGLTTIPHILSLITKWFILVTESRVKLIKAIFALLVLTAVGTFGLMYFEELSAFDSFWRDQLLIQNSPMYSKKQHLSK